MIEITLTQISLGLVSLGIIQFLSSVWVKTRIEKSIQYEYDRILEEHRFDQMVRQKAEATAKLFSKWIQYRGQEEHILDQRELIDYYEELNRMVFEISFWIKDEKLLSDIMLRLQNHGNAKSIFDLIVDLRKKILNDKGDTFLSSDMTIFPDPKGSLSKKLYFKK